MEEPEDYEWFGMPEITPGDVFMWSIVVFVICVEILVVIAMTRVVVGIF